MKYLSVLENAYKALLSLGPIKRLDFQSELAGLRDAIAEITEEDAEIVQNKYENLFVYDISFTGHFVSHRPSHYRDRNHMKNKKLGKTTDA